MPYVLFCFVYLCFFCFPEHVSNLIFVNLLHNYNLQYPNFSSLFWANCIFSENRPLYSESSKHQVSGTEGRTWFMEHSSQHTNISYLELFIQTVYNDRSHTNTHTHVSADTHSFLFFCVFACSYLRGLWFDISNKMYCGWHRLVTGISGLYYPTIVFSKDIWLLYGHFFLTFYLFL